MIHLLYGDDEFSLGETLESMKQQVEPAELRDVNITTLEGPALGIDELVSTSMTVPFLAERRMVIVKGLLGIFEPAATFRPGGRQASTETPALERWKELPDRLEHMPPTTDLVLVDRLLRETNPMLRRLRDQAEVKAFPVPVGNALRQWVHQRAERYRVNIDGDAAAALAESIGNNLRVIDTELQKLSLYRGEQGIRRDDVEELVAYVREASIFVAVDAVLEGRPGVAMKSIHQILDSGRPPSYVITMIARQVRLLLLAKELRGTRVPMAEMGRRLSLSGYPLRKTLEQEGKFTMERLVQIHRKLLEADLGIKTGEASEQLILDMLIAELASGAAARR